MSVNSRLHNIEKSLQYRELALLWLKTSQERSGYADYWKIGEFQPWVADNEEAGLLYHLVFEVNGAVMTPAEGWRVLASWASLLGIAMIEFHSDPKRAAELGRLSGESRKVPVTGLVVLPPPRPLTISTMPWDRSSLRSVQGETLDGRSGRGLAEDRCEHGSLKPSYLGPPESYRSAISR